MVEGTQRKRAVAHLEPLPFLKRVYPARYFWLNTTT